jgi:HAD superfamily hydrolase (TIGR01509 family)
MIKHIIFDLDGVLVDVKDIHFNALNKALERVDPLFVIGRDEHLNIYDGLPTVKKLNLLTQNKGLSPTYYNQILEHKQNETRVSFNNIEYSSRLCNVLKELKEKKLIISVASNSIRESVKIALVKTGLINYVDFFLSNEDCKLAKPRPEIFLRSMIIAGVGPRETLIVEDSVIGQEAANLSGAILCPVRTSQDVTLDYIETFLQKTTTNMSKWKSDHLNIVIPMAGAGSRFEKAGYTFPKPLIEVNGKPMIQVVVENLNIDAKYHFIVQKEHYEKYNLKETLNLISPNCNIIFTSGITEGAACTTLLAKEFINNNNSLLIANSDQFLEWNSTNFMYNMIGDSVDAGIVTFTSTHPKWSFAKIDETGKVIEVAEKKPISNIATAGIYYWKNGSDYVKYAEQMIQKNVRVNNEFYVCPVFNEAIADDKIIKTYNISKMWGIGTPEDLDIFLKR